MSISAGQPVVIPDPAKDTPGPPGPTGPVGPAGPNLPVNLIQAPFTVGLASTVLNNNFGYFTNNFFVNPIYYPNLNSAYRLTLNYVINSCTFAAGTVNGSIGVIVVWTLGTNVIVANMPEVTNYVNGGFTSSSRFPGNTLTYVFKPVVSGTNLFTLNIGATNTSGQNLTGFNITITYMAIEEISTNLTIKTVLSS
jgi:hypothetical protein